MTVGAMIKKPSGLIPIVMSIAAFALIPIQLITVGAAPQADEGTAARLFQLLLVLELPIVAYFALRWLPRYPKQALAVLALQALAGIAALAPIFIMGW